MTACPFCDIIDKRGYDPRLSDRGVAAVFSPLKPHAPGHVLVVPWKHVADATEDLTVTTATVRHAAWLIKEGMASGVFRGANLLTSVGAIATQSVFHLHFHIVPRGPDDTLRPRWPWIGSPSEP